MHWQQETGNPIAEQTVSVQAGWLVGSQAPAVSWPVKVPDPLKVTVAPHWKGQRPLQLEPSDVQESPPPDVHAPPVTF
jgi:hypothetical protein